VALSEQSGSCMIFVVQLIWITCNTHSARANVN
jgi:hypothetical protein